MVLLVLVILLISAVPVVAAPHVVLMVVDDQGLDAGCYGNPVVQTPHLDALAADGTRFDYAFCTTASYSASRSMILTGLINHANGQYGHKHGYNKFHTHRSLPADSGMQVPLRSLPILLSQAGYLTCSIGKYHVQSEQLYRFDVYANQHLIDGFRSTVQMVANAEEFIRADPS